MTKNHLDNETSSFRRSGLRAASLLAIPLLIAFAALASPQDRDHDRDRDRDDHNGLHVRSRDPFIGDFGGGRGGRPSRDALCEPGFVAIGFHVQTGEFFNQAWLDCARLHPDGDLGNDIRMTERTGSPGGRPVWDAHCRGGRALVGLRGRTGASIDEAVGECSNVREIAEMRREHPDNDRRDDDRRGDDHSGYRRDEHRIDFTESVTRPHPGGRPAETQCPPGAVVTGLRSMSGEYMDHLWIVCSEVERND
jgi:hypothetical protein